MRTSSERVCELHPRAENPSPRTLSHRRGSINRRVRVVDVYRMAPRFEFTDTLSVLIWGNTGGRITD